MKPDHTRFRHKFGTSITCEGVDPMHGKDLTGIKSDRVYGRTCSRSAETMVFHYAPVRTAFTFILMCPKLQN